MALKQISQLPPKPVPVAATDQFGIDDNSAVSYKVTMAQMQTYVNSHLPAALNSIVNLTIDPDYFIYTSSTNTFSAAPFTSAARSMVAQATFADILSTIGALPLAGGTMTGNLILNADPTTDFQAATKHYVDIVASGISVQGACRVATPSALTVTYDNGASGVGATLTNAGAQAALAIDGVTLVLLDRVLVKDQASALQNGIYIVTDLGSVSTNWVLTRAADYNSSVEIAPGDLVPINEGSTNSATSWLETATVTTVGTDPINFTQFSLSPAALASAIQKNSYIAANDTGAANAYVAALSPAPVAYTANMGFIVKIANPNTGACTINLNALGLVNIKRTDGTDPAANDLLTGMYAWFLYNGTNALLINPAGYLKPASNLSDVVNKATANVNLVSTLAINAISNISSGDWGKTVVCTGAAAYSVTLSTHVANRWIKFSIQTTSSAVINIIPFSGTINGQASLFLGSGDAVTLWDDGTNYWVVEQFLQPSNFVAYRNANQLITTGSNQEIVFNVAPVNVGGFFNTTTGRFLPLLPGRYRFQWCLAFAAGSTAYTQATRPFVNSVTQIGQTIYVPASVGQTLSHTSGGQWILNGSTDYLSIWAFQNSGGSINITGDATPTYQAMVTGERISLF